MSLSRFNHIDFDVCAPAIDVCAPAIDCFDVCAPTVELCAPAVEVCAPAVASHIDVLPAQQFATVRTVQWVPTTTWVNMSRRQARKLGYRR